MLVSKFCDFWLRAIFSRFSNFQNYYFMDFWLGSWRLSGRKNVSEGHKISIPLIEKLSVSSFSSRGLFFSWIWTVRSRKRKVLSRKRKLGLDVFLLGIYLLVSGPTEHLFYTVKQFFLACVVIHLAWAWELCYSTWGSALQHSYQNRDADDPSWNYIKLVKSSTK